MVTSNFVGLIMALGTIIMARGSMFSNITTEAISGIIFIGLLGTSGQCFIYLTISKFNTFLLATITTTRKFFSILISVIVFGHPMTNMHYVAIAIVFSAIIFDMVMSER